MKSKYPLPRLVRKMKPENTMKRRVFLVSGEQNERGTC